MTESMAPVRNFNVRDSRWGLGSFASRDIKKEGYISEWLVENIS
jgi:hypothetical protein